MFCGFDVSTFTTKGVLATYVRCSIVEIIYITRAFGRGRVRATYQNRACETESGVTRNGNGICCPSSPIHGYNPETFAATWPSSVCFDM